MSKRGTLIFGGWLVRDWLKDGEDPLGNGAIVEEGGRIVAVGTFDELSRRYPYASRIGDPDAIVAPGFVNAHSHGRGLTTYQMGQPDEPLETRIVEMLGRAEWGGSGGSGGGPAGNTGYDPYLDTLYSCAKQILSGITTTLHSHQYFDGPVGAYEERTRKTVEAYRDSGLRTVFALGVRDRSTYAFAEDAAFVASLPPESRKTKDLVPGDFMPFADFKGLLETLAADYTGVAFQMGPWNPVFCSDSLMRQIAELSRVDGWRIQTHLMETFPQAQFARKHFGQSWVTYLREIGMLSPRFSGAHCVWFDADDIAMTRDAGAQVVHNPSSNLRLQSGIAPIRQMLDAKVPVAFGLDSLGMNDDEDMFQDLRLAHLVQATPTTNGESISPASMLDMATRAGSAVAGIPGIGTLEPGNWADAILLTRNGIEDVRLPHPLSDVVLKRAKPAHVHTVIVGGQVLLERGRLKNLNPEQMKKDLAATAKPAAAGQSPVTASLKSAVRNYLKA